MSKANTGAITAFRPARRVVELDGLRAFAILPVILHHCYPNDGSLAWLALLGQAGWVGVDLFFVLSGYLITGILLDSVKDDHYYRNFITRRTLRIFPLYYLCLGLFTAATVFSSNPGPWAAMQNWGGVGWFVAYLGNFRAAWVRMEPPVFSFGPLWSLQVEEQFYLLYPLIVAVLPIRSLRRFLIGCVIVAFLFRCGLRIFVDRSFLATYQLMPSRMDALALGGLVAIMFRTSATLSIRPVQIRLWALASGGAVLGMYFASVAWPWFITTLGYSLNALLFASLLTVILLSPESRAVGWLRWRPLVYTGQIAYGLYLLHGPASWVARKTIEKFTGVEIPGKSGMSVVVTFIASFVVAALSWHFFEEPILRFKDRFTLRNKAAGQKEQPAV